MTPLTIVFAGSPAAAVPSLDVLARSPHEVVTVVTRQDSPQGRRRVMTPTPVAEAADRLGLPVLRTNVLREEATRAITALAPDLGVIVAYGALVREPLLSAPRLGWINLHFSQLPRWRGAAPVQHALIAGDEETGAAVFSLVPDLDAGDVYGTVPRRIGPGETAGDLLTSLADLGALLLARVVDELANGTATAAPQVGEVTLAPKLTLADGRIDWTLDGRRVADRIRGVTPEPGAFTTVDGARLKVLEARLQTDAGDSATDLAPGSITLVGRQVLVGTASNPVELVVVQPEGRRAMAAPDWLRGRPNATAVAE